MSETDKRLRQHAIPFQGKWFSNYVGTGTGSQLANGVADGDLAPWANLAQSTQIRIAKPSKGDLVQARLSFNAVSSDGGFTEMILYWGDFDTDGVTPLALTRAEMIRRHKLLTGRSAEFNFGVQNNIIIDGLNFMPFIPKRGDAGFNEDAFIIGIDYSEKNPPVFSPFKLFEFKVDCAVQIAEVQA